MSKTLLQLRTRVLTDLAMEDDDFAAREEVDRLINAGIKDAESLIHNLYEDYFLTSAALTLVQNASAIDLPSDIFAHKIRGIVYDDGAGWIYEVRRIKNWHKFALYQGGNYLPSALEEYRYLLKNASAAAGTKIVIVPPAQVSSASVMTIWYIREAAQLALDTDICDIPEFEEYPVQFAKAHLSKKEGSPTADMEWNLLERQRQLLNSTLATMIPDDDTEIEMDLRHYDDHV